MNLCTYNIFYKIQEITKLFKIILFRYAGHPRVMNPEWMDISIIDLSSST